MRFSNAGYFNEKMANIKESLEAMNKVPEDYNVYIKHYDLLYPINGFSCGNTDNKNARFSCEVMKDKEVHRLTVRDLKDMLLSFSKDIPNYESKGVFAEKAKNIYETLDMGLFEPHTIGSWGSCDMDKGFYFITDIPMAWL
jgi:hypothetical protein